MWYSYWRRVCLPVLPLYIRHYTCILVIPFFVFSTPSKDAHRCTYTHTHHTHIHTLILTPSHRHPHPHTLTCMLSYDCGGETVHTPSLQYRKLPSPPPGRGYQYCECGTEGLRHSSASKPCRVHLSTGTHMPGSPVYKKIRETLTNLLTHIGVKGIPGVLVWAAIALSLSYNSQAARQPPALIILS